MGAFSGHYAYDSATPVSYFGFTDPTGAPTLPPAGAPYEADALSKSGAAFGDTSCRIADRLTLGAGLRYFTDDQKYVVNYFGSTTQGGNFHATSPRAYAQFKVAEQFNIYAS